MNAPKDKKSKHSLYDGSNYPALRPNVTSTVQGRRNIKNLSGDKPIWWV